jgi:hypothetical protein
LSIRLLIVCCLVLASAAGLAACGNDDPRVENFRSEANAICRTAGQRIAQIPGRESLKPGSRTLADFAAEMGADVESLRSELSGVDVPSELADDFGAYDGHLAEQERGWEELVELTAPVSRDRANLRLATEPAAGRDAQKLGLDDCVDANEAITLRR